MKLFKYILIVLIVVIFIIFLVLHINRDIRNQNSIEKEFLKNKDMFENIRTILEEKDKICFYYEGKNTYRIRENGNDRLMTDEDRKTYEEVINCINKLKLHRINKYGEKLEFQFSSLSTTAKIIVYSENIQKYYNDTSDIVIKRIIDNWYYVE